MKSVTAVSVKDDVLIQSVVLFVAGASLKEVATYWPSQAKVCMIGPDYPCQVCQVNRCRYSRLL